MTDHSKHFHTTHVTMLEYCQLHCYVKHTFKLPTAINSHYAK